ncbi:MAG: HEPN domain-containing protein, partial [bacterium]|nr:HEPN domain-containing protein [bacterium]
ELVNEWIKKADGDFRSALREYRARKEPNYDAAGFHAQQSVEKYLKAILQNNNIPFQKIHDLLALMELCLPVFPEIELQKELLGYLNQFSIKFRYPGEEATREQAKSAIHTLKILIPILREKLAIPKT